MFAALGHGRSFGAPSKVGFRTLPGILESGLWAALQSSPEVPTRALVTDVGNDILYGFSAGQILTWVGEAINRLQRITNDIVLTNLPLVTIRKLSETKFLIFRSILFPSSRLLFSNVLEAVERVDAGLRELSAVQGIRLFRLDPAWYGFDPIHVRRSLWRLAWREILGACSEEVGGGGSFLEGLRLRLMPPERRWLFGVEQFTPQSGRRLPLGGRVWLY